MFFKINLYSLQSSLQYKNVHNLHLVLMKPTWKIAKYYIIRIDLPLIYAWEVFYSVS